MSINFIKDKVGTSSISVAKRQQDNILYFINSTVQEDITLEYIKKYAERNYRGNEDFLNWVKMIFRSENFMTFFKYFRTPNPSSSLIQNRVVPPLKRVFYSEDSYFKYLIRGKEVEQPKEIEKDFYKKLLTELIHNHNAVIVHDLSDINKPFRSIVEIDKIVSIDSFEGIISRIAYTASIKDENGNDVNGYAYIDKNVFAFYESEKDIPLKEVPHDLGYCPAFYLSNEAFDNKEDVVRKSIFSHVRSDLEEYSFLKTLQKMSEAGGVIPVQAMFDVKTEVNEGRNVSHSDKMPMSLNELRGQKAEQASEVTGGNNVLQPGSTIKVPVKLKTDGSVDSDFLKNFIAFHHTPVEPLEYLTKRIEKIEQSIIINLLGDYSESDESAKNELQVSKSYVSKEDRLRDLSSILSEVATKSDSALLHLAYGVDNTNAEVYFGSDFFLETEKELYEMFKLAPNPLERKDILVRKALSSNRFNPEKAKKNALLYKLLPFASDLDFNKAIDNNLIDPITFELQNRFYYWINLFEATYGSLLSFWDDKEQSESQKLILINNLLRELITKNLEYVTEKNRAS